MPFHDRYRPDAVQAAGTCDVSAIAHMETLSPGVGAFLTRNSGTSFNQGLYRIHPIDAMMRWTRIVAYAFPDFRNRIFCFSYDWLGRHFAVDFERLENGACQVIMFEPGTGQALEIPASFQSFHDAELVDFQNESLAADFYRAWLSTGGALPDMSQCIGYKKPLFLDGKDAVENLELIDMEVYWAILGQLLTKIRGLPPGSRLGSISIQ